jgi:folate-binding protein YgfZ
MSAVELAFDRARIGRVRDGAIVAVTEPAIFGIEGAGALSCLQGLLTNDVVKPGEGSVVYGALLTPKGMIVVDVWALRHGGAFVLVAPARAREATQLLLARSLPPRLARVTDLTGAHRAAWLVGAHAFEVLVRSGLAPLPEACGRVSAADAGGGQLLVALAPEGAPFTALAVGPAAAVDAFAARLERAGAVSGDPADLEASRILRGWPALGVEIDERTLPQEVRYDQIGGVSYTKGCYTGQETVARLHFRGHTNRELRGLVWRNGGPLAGESIVAGDREVGSVRSLLALDDRVLGLALVRREVLPGERVTAAGAEATVVELPFAAPEVDG